MERNLTWHNMDIDRTLREQQMGQNACTIWMSGLSGAGKSTILKSIIRQLKTIKGGIYVQDENEYKKLEIMQTLWKSVCIQWEKRPCFWMGTMYAWG